MEWGFATAASLFLAIVGVLVYLLQEKREKERQREQLPPGNPDPVVSLLFVAGRPGYRLLEIEPRALSVGSLLDLDGDTYIVARVGPSPYPADRRLCAFVEPRSSP